jgi:hypothetical protein
MKIPMLSTKHRDFGFRLAIVGVLIGFLGAILSGLSRGGTESIVFVLGYSLAGIGVLVVFVGVGIHILRSLEYRKRE